jgi:putative transposase
MATQLRHGRHSVTDKAHLVCVVKCYSSVFTAESLQLIEESFRGVAAKMGCQVLEFNREGDPSHALVEYPPKLSVSQLVNTLKGASSRRYGKAVLPKP